MNKALITVALRYRAIYLNVNRTDTVPSDTPTVPVLAFIARLKENGFSVSERLLHALNGVCAGELADLTVIINDVMGVHLNWAPLVKSWNIPTGENCMDHLVTFLANCLGGEKAGLKGTTLPCGHFIPDGTFPLERYNGCPFCGKPFKTAGFVYKGQGSKLKELRLFTDEDMKRVFLSLLQSPVPLDGTQRDSFKKLLSMYEVPDKVNIPMKETIMLVIRALVKQGKGEKAAFLLKTPTDILRYLWYEKTKNVQIIEPRTLIANARKCYFHMFGPLDRSADAAESMKQKLMLKYDRRTCRVVASWLNALPLTAVQAAENMHPKRGMWVRMIRALRLGEYARRGFNHLAEILDVFYNQSYTTFQGKIDKARETNNAEAVLALLRQRPGLFARCLFATMLRYGSQATLNAFQEVADRMPARLLLSLENVAEEYFDCERTRLARPITGGTKIIPPNKLLTLYSDLDRCRMVEEVKDVYTESMKRRFARIPATGKTMYIEPMLFNIPVSVGDRSATIQDTSCALPGTLFPVEGDTVRLFMQWGKGLPAQHLDMDLSCRITFADRKEVCAYYHLTATGARHSGDIREIPDQVGTAEYINLDLNELRDKAAQYVIFTCNAYSCGTLSPNLVVGWMDSSYPMKISKNTGVAYDPSCVQHMVRISESNLAKGLVFGILDVKQREIIWLEMPFTSQTIQGCSTKSVEALLDKLRNKVSVGDLLQLKAEAQHLELVKTPETADESYTYEWALNPAEVSLLLNI